MMRVATWNMRRRRANWDVLPISGLDIALLQEACPPPSSLAGHVEFQELEPRRGSGTWGTAIWSRWPLHGLSGSTCHPGAAVVAEIEAPGGPVTTYSLYALFEYIQFSTRRAGYAVTTLHRLLSDLTGHLEEPARRARNVLGGDFNCNPKWDLKSGYPTNRLLIDRVEAYGLTSVLPIDAHRQIPTFRKSQIDYLFTGTAFSIDAANVDTDGLTRGLSDHHPVVAQLTDKHA